jgi:opine dehydrogenase
MEKDLVAVLGGGNGGHAVAANLSLAGFRVNFFELPQFGDSFEKVLRTREIRIEGVSIDGVAKLNLATLDIERAIKDVEIIFVVTPAFGHKAMAEACTPFAQDGQIFVLMPGSGGSLEFANIFKQKKVKSEITFAESCTLPYGARLRGLATSLFSSMQSSFQLGSFQQKEQGM